MNTIKTSNFEFPGQTKVYHGKVRDVYTTGEDILVMITTDRISAFDVVLPKAIPYKGQVLNQISLKFLEATKNMVPNWILASPHPNVIIGKRAEPFMVEMIVRATITGSSWRLYSKEGGREICGLTLPEGLREHEAFAEPILTPTTKAEQGNHDENISKEEILAQGLVSPEDYEVLEDYTRKLFAYGQKFAEERGLILVDTKYEFGKNGNIMVIDEIHTPDSSRYFLKDSYDDYVASDYNPEKKPKPLSKEFVREWLMDHGFKGEAGQAVPEMDDNFILQVSERYQELYENVTGERFEPYPVDEEEIFDAVLHALDALAT